MKIKQNENALVTTENLLPMVAADQLVNVSSPDSRLPSLKIINSIEVNPSKGITKDMSGMLVLQDGESTQIVPKGSIITVLAARDAVRRLEVEIDGNRVPFDRNDKTHEKLDKTYTRAFKALGNFNASHEKFIAGLKDESFQRGSVYLLALINDNGTAICELGAFKTQASYWYRPLAQAILHPNKMAIQITENDHSGNLKESKANSTHQYFDPAKHNQYKVVELTAEQLAGIAAAVEGSKPDVDSWFNR